MSASGYKFEIFLSNDHTVIHTSEHWDRDNALAVIPALGYSNLPANLVTASGTVETYSVTGADHIYAKVSRLRRAPEPTYNFVVTVRITGERNGWNVTVLDTPKFVLMSNVGGGSIYTYPGVRGVVRNMFAASMRDGDAMHVTIQPLEN